MANSRSLWRTRANEEKTGSAGCEHVAIAQSASAMAGSCKRGKNGRGLIFWTNFQSSRGRWGVLSWICAQFEPRRATGFAPFFLPWRIPRKNPWVTFREELRFPANLKICPKNGPWFVIRLISELFSEQGCYLHGMAIAPQSNMCPAWCGGCGFVTKPATRELRKRLTACLW